MGGGGPVDAGGPGGEHDPTSIDTTCPACGQRMRPIDLGSGAVVLRCLECGQTAI